VDVVFQILRGIVLGQFFLRARALCFDGGSRTVVLSFFSLVGAGAGVDILVAVRIGIGPVASRLWSRSLRVRAVLYGFGS